MENSTKRMSRVVVFLDLMAVLLLVNGNRFVSYMENAFSAVCSVDYAALFAHRIHVVIGLLVFSLVIHLIRSVCIPSGLVIDLSMFSAFALGIVSFSCFLKLDTVLSFSSFELLTSLYFATIVFIVMFASVVTFGLNTLDVESLFDVVEE